MICRQLENADGHNPAKHRITRSLMATMSVIGIGCELNRLMDVLLRL